MSEKVSGTVLACEDKVTREECNVEFNGIGFEGVNPM